jgi:ParB/RepB/Spo0J family partition protein
VRIAPQKLKGDRLRVAYEVVIGGRRHAAALLAGLQVVPAIVRMLSNDQVREIQLIENVQRKDLEPVEQGQGYKDLIDNHGYTADSLAEKLGMSKTHVYAMVKLAQAPPTGVRLFNEGKISRTHLELVSRIPNPEQRETAAQKLLKPRWAGGDMLSVRELKASIEQDYMRQLKGAPFPTEDAELVPEAGPCSTCPKRTGNDRQTFPDGRADVCTDTACFALKVSTWKTQELERIKEKGIKVLSEPERKRVFPYGGCTEVNYACGYLDLKDQVTVKGKRPSFRQLVGEELKDKIVAAVDDENHVHYLVLKEDAAPVLKKKGVKSGRHSVDMSASDRRWEREMAARRKRDEEVKRRRNAGHKLAIDKVAEVAASRYGGVPGGSTPAMTAMMRSLATGLVRECWHEYVKKVITRRRLERTKHVDDKRALQSYIETMNAQTCVGVMAELVGWKVAETSAYASDGDQQRGRDFWKSFGVDLAKCMRDGLKALKSKGKKKPKKKAVKK